MHKICAINLRPEDKESISFIKRIVKLLETRKIGILLPDYEILRNSSLAGCIAKQEKFISSPDLVISVGGDGTLLHTARLFAGTDKPIFGINRGRLGFLTEFMPEEAIDYLDIIINGKYEKSKRDRLELVQLRDGKEVIKTSLLNDVAISRGIFSRPITVHLEIDGKYLNTFSGDGLIVATSTGSTAYPLSAGGPIITPAINGIMLIMPICPHTLATRPLIIPGTSRLLVTVSPKFENTVMTIDGHESISITGEDKIFFTGSDKKTVLIAHPGKNFYEILKEKFNWGANAFT
jgi:NAD+ kinase